MGALYGFTGPPDPRLQTRMGDALRHRGNGSCFTDTGDSATRIYTARFDERERRRLGAGLYTDGDQTIALAGALHTASPEPPTLPELLEWYRHEGPGFVRRLRGAFVLAVRDRATIHLVRDGAGQRTIYYGRGAGRFIFAIEPKAVLAVPGFPRRLRPAAVAEYLTFSFIPGSRTMLEDLHELPSGHHLSCNGESGPVLERYFAFEETAPESCTPSTEWVDRFRTQFGRAVAERLPTGQPVTVFLSGGLDSSIVTAEVARQHDRPVRTYAIHFGRQYPHELDFARAVAERCGTHHEEVLIRPKDFLPHLRKIIWYLDEPIGDPITVPNFQLAARVSDNGPWVFNGEGGDPCFGGPKNIPMMLNHWYGGMQRDARFRERMYLASYRRAYDDLTQLISPEWQRHADVHGDLEGILEPFFAGDRPTHFLNKLMAINIRLKGAHLILPKVERMLGASGLVPLSPLFDEQLIRLSFAMPPRMKLADGVEKVVLKRAYGDCLPAEVIDRPKSGMRVPVHFWFQGEMKRYARKILSPRSVRNAGIFDEKRVRQLLAYDSEEGASRFGLRLWMLITFELWRRMVIEGESP